MLLVIEGHDLPAKLMLGDVPDPEAATVTAGLTDERLRPRCARLRPPALAWS